MDSAPRHGIKSVERFIEHQNRGMMRDGLGQPYALAHAFAVSSHFTMRCFAHGDAIDGFSRQRVRLQGH